VSDVDVIRRIYDASAASSIERAAELLDPDIEWDTSTAPTGVKVRGVEPIEAVRAQVWRVRDGRAVSMKQYMDPREAYEALGLHPEP